MEQTVYTVWSADFANRVLFDEVLETTDLHEAQQKAIRVALSFHGDGWPVISDWCGEGNNEMHVRMLDSGGGALIWRWTKEADQQ
jgi:hypothetical protein